VDKPQGQIHDSWLNQLDAAKNALDEYARKMVDGSAEERMGKFSEIYSNLLRVEEKLGGKPLSKEKVNAFCEPLVRRELESLFGREDWASLGEQKIMTILRDHFSIVNNPFEYEKLCEYIRDNFNKFAGESMRRIFCEDKTVTASEDADNLSQALNCWIDPNSPLTDGVKKNVGKGFVPQDFEKLLNEHRSKSQMSKPAEIAGSTELNDSTQTEEPMGPDLSAVPEKEILIVTREQLSKGIEVALLKALVVPQNDENTKINLNKYLKIDENEYIFMNRNEFFSQFTNDSKNIKEVKIYKDGKFFFNQSDVVLTVSNNGRTCESWLLVDEAGGEPIKSSLFSLEKNGENEVKLIGEIVDWIKLAKNTYRKELKLKINNSFIPIVKNNEEFFLYKDPESMPLVLSDADIANVTEDLNYLLEKEEEIDKIPNGSKKVRAQEERAPLLENLKNSLEKAVGGGVLLKALNLNDHCEITEQHRSQIEDLLNRKNTKTYATHANNWKQYLENTKADLGKKFLDTSLRKEIDQSFSWESYAKSPSSKIQKVVNDLIKKSRDWKKPPSLFERLQGFETFTIVTINDRVVFDAHKKL